MYRAYKPDVFQLIPISILLVFITITNVSSVASSKTPLPAWSLTTLSGQEVTLPPLDKPHILILGFDHKHQAIINPWIEYFSKQTDLAFFELPFVPIAAKKFRFAVERFMLGKLPDKSWQQYVAPLYGNLEDIKQALAIKNHHTIHILLISQGNIKTAHITGDFTPQKAQKLVEQARRDLSL